MTVLRRTVTATLPEGQGSLETCGGVYGERGLKAHLPNMWPMFVNNFGHGTAYFRLVFCCEIGQELRSAVTNIF